MGFFGLQPQLTKTSNTTGARNRVSVELLHRTECKSCPLNHAECKHGKMEPHGDDSALIYVLGSAPNRRDDKTGKSWTGLERSIIKKHIPPLLFSRIRFGNVIRTYPGDGKELTSKSGNVYDHMPREPTDIEIECCRPSVIKDIEEVKPVAIFGFGSVPLRWALRETHPSFWQGRRLPVRVGTHTCWYYPFVDPIDAVKDSGRWDGHIDDKEHTFGVAVRNACAQVRGETGTPIIHDRDRIWRGVEVCMGDNGSTDLRRIEKHLIECANSITAGLDYETNALRPYNNSSYLLTAAVAHKTRALAFPFEHRESKWTSGELDRLEAMFQEFLMAKKVKKIVHQLAFEMEWSAFHFGKPVLRTGKWEDTISEAYIIDETQGLLALECLTQQYFGFNIKEMSNVNRKKLDDEPLEKVLWYNGLDAKYHRELHLVQMPVLQELDMVPVYRHQVRRIPTLVLTQMEGIPINQEERKAFSKSFKKTVNEALVEMKAMPFWSEFAKRYKTEFKPGSNPDVAKAMTMLGIKMPKSASGGDGTDQMFLKKLKHPIGKALLKYRKASKILSTYVAPITPGSEHLFDDKKIHPIVSTTKVRTWRTSSEDPNIQNWPNRGPNAIIRRCISKPLFKVVKFDYASIQARNVAMESRDPTLIKAFIEGYDIHKDWVINLAKRDPGWALDGLMKDKAIFKAVRSGVKNQFVFPSFFGAGPKSIAPNLGINGKRAPNQSIVEAMQEEFFDRFPLIKKWQLKQNANYMKYGYVTGLSGFRRHAPISWNEIINSPIQSDESLIVLNAMSELSEIDPDLYTPMMEIHDDLTFLWPVNEVDKRAPVVIAEMVKPHFDWIAPVPLVVEMEVGDNWKDCEAIGSFENVGVNGDYKQVEKV